jgi:cytochrome P450
LPWSRACLLEASRLHPAAPLLLRVALRDTTLGDVPIPQGSALVASTALLGRDAAVWEAPNAFMPERFVDGHEPQERGAQAARAQLASFGSGPRSCVGQQLALTLASLTLAHMMAASVSPASPND